MAATHKDIRRDFYASHLCLGSDSNCPAQTYRASTVRQVQLARPPRHRRETTTTSKDIRRILLILLFQYLLKCFHFLHKLFPLLWSRGPLLCTGDGASSPARVTPIRNGHPIRKTSQRILCPAGLMHCLHVLEAKLVVFL